jgi:molybdopterin-synthase adenylyltransferase
MIGLGGGGSHIAQQCAHIGLLNYRLADPDEIEDSNLNRLVGATALDVAMRLDKVLIAERTIRGIRPEARVRRFKRSWHDVMGELKACDVIFACVDSFIERQLIESFCRRYRIVLIDIGMTVRKEGEEAAIYGQVVTSIPGLPCFRCMGFLNDENLKQEADKYGDAGAGPQVVWSNGVLASLAVGQLLTAVSDWNTTGVQALYLEYDGNRHTVQESQLSQLLRNHQCPHFPIEEVGDVSF